MPRQAGSSLSSQTLGVMKLIRILPLSAAFSLCALVQSASAVNDPAVPKPYVVAPECTPEQLASAITVAREPESVIACFYLEKWSFKGAALAVSPKDYANREVAPEEFHKLSRSIFAGQSARLRTERDLKEAMEGEPPAHASTPLSLFVHARTPLGVFLNENKYIGFADLVPLYARSDRSVQQELYPLVQLEIWVLAKGRVFKLIQVSPISGPSTIGEGFRMADDWARRFNGSERLATED